jgi:hypothetical protein
MNEKPVCANCGMRLAFRRWSNRLPKYSEALADCPVCGGRWQVRYFGGVQSSEPYQVRGTARKKCAGSYRVTPERMAMIMSVWGSVQEFLDNAPVVLCNTRQLNT